MTTTHGDVMDEIAEQFRPVLEESTDGVYLWLDDAHMVCNERLARMFGYESAVECGAVQPFLDAFVAEEDRYIYGWNYQNRVATLAHPVTFRFRAMRKDGSTFAAETDMIPISWRGHAVAYHFVRQVGGNN